MKLVQTGFLFLVAAVMSASASNILHRSIHQISFVQPFQASKTQWFEYTGDIPTQSQIVFAQLIVRDLTSSPPQEVWAIRNLPILPFHGLQSLSQWVDLSALNVVGGDPTPVLGLYTEFTTSVISTKPVYDTLTADSVFYTSESIYVPDGTTAQFALPLQPIFAPAPVFGTSTIADSSFHGTEFSVTDLDSTQYNAAITPGYTGDMNNCGPASAANSFQWLEFLHPEIATNTTARQKLVELSTLTKRGVGAGVTTGQLVQAELAYIDKHKLPLAVKFQSAFLSRRNIHSPDTTGGKGYGHQAECKGDTALAPTWSWLVGQLQGRAAVQMMIGFYNSTGRVSGHWVTVVGCVTNGSVHHLWIRDDRDENSAGGGDLRHFIWDTANAGWPYLVEANVNGFTVYIESLVSVEYDGAIKYDVRDIHLQQASVTGAKPQANVLDGNFIVQLDTSYRIRFLNVLAHNPNAADPNEVVWLVRNMMWMPPRVQTVTVPVDFGPLGFQPGQPIGNIDVDVQEGYTQWTAVGTPDGWQSIEADHIVLNVAEGVHSPAIIQFAKPQPLFFAATGPQHFDTVYRGTGVPNIDLDSSVNYSGSTPNYAGDEGAGAPAAVANGLQWLERTNPSLDSTSTARQKLVELSSLMKRTANTGVSTEAMIRGNLAFLDKFKIPVSIKFQSTEFRMDTTVHSPDTTGGTGYGHAALNANSADSAPPSWSFLSQAMHRGEAVELNYGRYDSTGKRVGGNAVVVTGVAEIGDSVRRIWFVDDTYQAGSGGLHESIVTWDSTAGYVYLHELSNDHSLRVVEGVIAENYDASVTFKKTAVAEPLAMSPATLHLEIGSNPAGSGVANSISFLLGSSMPVNITVYNALGSEIAVLNDNVLDAGSHHVQWDGRTMQGVAAGSGTYFVVVKTPKMQSSGTLVRVD